MPTPLIAQRDMPYSSLETVLNDAVNEGYDTAAYFLADSLAMGLAECGAKALGQVKAFIEAMDFTVRSSRNQLTNAHEQLAKGMQQATLTRYLEMRAQGRMSGPYRLSARDAGHKMEEAIRSADFVRGTYDGIGFANTYVLDRTARQWHRLNFGAGGAAGPGGRRYAVHWGNVTIASLGLDDSPSAGFSLPRGFWRSPSGRFAEKGGRGDQFFPNRRGPGPIQTRGIRAWHFLEAGDAYLAEHIGPAYDAVYKDWYESAKRSKGPIARLVDVKVPKPRNMPVRL